MTAFPSNLHTHSIFSDGKSTLEEYVQAALMRGFKSLGFSEHAPGDDCEIPEEKMPEYMAEIAMLKQKYASQIELYTGLEFDYYAPAKEWRHKLDYTIGSVHSIKVPGGERLAVDYLHEDMAKLVDILGEEDMVREYYRLVRGVLTENPDIIGHLDLITKLNTQNRYFNPNAKYYINAAEETIAAIANAGVIAEVNTGAIARGYTTKPYPSKRLMQILYSYNVPLTISSDAHSADMIDCAFEYAIELLRGVGYNNVMLYCKGRFEEFSI